jgi:hypothetical protein
MDPEPNPVAGERFKVPSALSSVTLESVEPLPDC